MIRPTPVAVVLAGVACHGDIRNTVDTDGNNGWCPTSKCTVVSLGTASWLSFRCAYCIARVLRVSEEPTTAGILHSGD